jgi:hypothetical protein
MEGSKEGGFDLNPRGNKETPIFGESLVAWTKQGKPSFCELPEVLSGKNIPKDQQPTLEDFVYLQGGMPIILENIPGRSYWVIHAYENKKDPSSEGMAVSTSVFIVERWGKGAMTRKTAKDGRDITVPVALLRQYHGDPCEAKSAGRGEGYPRVPIFDSKKPIEEQTRKWWNIVSKF